MPHAHDPELDAVAAELCALVPAEFTAARNARAAASSPDLARRIRTLRKPVVAAWAVDLLAHDGLLAEALDLAAALRVAQDDLDAAELSRLGRQRRQLVAALAAQAAALAADRGVTVGAAARDDVEKTLNAAMTDAAAAAAVMTGRLTQPLDPGAVEPGTLAESVAGSVPGVPASASPPDDLAQRRARKQAERAARDAEQAAGRARRELAEVTAQRDRARERAAHLRERIDDLQRDLARMQADLADVEGRLGDLEDARTASAASARDAARNAERARAALD